jgi:acetoin:2,6-dichlorophenolindophenol oxidoreductase subunit beta
MNMFLESLRGGLEDAMERQQNLFLLGEDLLDPYGGAFKVTQGLSTRFPERVLTTPISEAAIVGLANGMALRGLYPVVEIMFGDFITLAADQIINYAAKFRQMYNFQVNLPLVIRTPMGGGRGYGPTHSQSLERVFLGIPGLNVVAPSHFHDPGRLLAHAILRDLGPVLFLEHKLLYSARLALEPGAPLRLESRAEDSGYPTAIVKNYTDERPDVTLIAYGGVSLMLAALMEKMAAEEIRILACLPSALQPLPFETMTSCCAASGRVIIIEEGPLSFGWGAEAAARLTESLWGRLLAPIRRVAASDTIIPAARNLEKAVLPSLSDIETAIFEVIS